MTEKIFLTKLKKLSKTNQKFYFDSEYEISGEESEIVFGMNDNGMQTNCASVEFHDFEFNNSVFTNPQEAFKLIMDWYIEAEGKPFIIFSDSKRNNVIYDYLDEFKDQPNFTMFEHKTNDKLSTIKTVIYCK